MACRTYDPDAPGTRTYSTPAAGSRTWLASCSAVSSRRITRCGHDARTAAAAGCDATAARGEACDVAVAAAGEDAGGRSGAVTCPPQAATAIAHASAAAGTLKIAITPSRRRAVVLGWAY